MVEKLLNKAMRADLHRRLVEAKATLSESGSSSEEVELIERFIEELSSGDWTKFGAIAGILEVKGTGRISPSGTLKRVSSPGLHLLS